MKFDVFLSHNSQDKPVVRALADWLRKHGVTPFLDETDLEPGEVLTDALGAAIGESRSTIICIGANGEGPWQKEEVNTLFNRSIKLSRENNEFRLIPVLLPNADTTKLRWFLETRLWCDLSQGITDSEAQLHRLKRAILGERPDHDITIDPGLNPYQGLKAFDRDTARSFFGRAGESARLAAKLHDRRFACIIGASGIGKSSLARAGLCSDAAERIVGGIGNWERLTVKPGSDLLRSLLDQLFAKLPNEQRAAAVAAALARIIPDPNLVTANSWAAGLDQEFRSFYSVDDRPVLILIDQFEELFTHRGFHAISDDQRERHTKRLLDGLAAFCQCGHRRWNVVLTLRSDFKHRCRVSEPFWNLLYKTSERTEVPHLVLELDELDEEGWREAIKAPAERVGAYLEAGLVETMLKDVYRQRGSMPLLQLALQELWKLRNGACLTHAAYASVGGVANALQRRADSALSLLNQDDPEYLAIARNLFLRLTSLGEGVSDTRRRVDRCELEWEGTDPEKIGHVIQRLADEEHRLIVTDVVKKRSDNNDQLILTDVQSLEVTHEVLIRDCSTIRDWIESARHDIPALRRLTHAARRWHENDNERNFLNAGDPPRELKRWINDTTLRLTTWERAYWQACRRDRARNFIEKREQQRQRTNDAIKAKIRFIVIAGVASVLAVAAVVTWLLSIRERDHAEQAVASGFVHSLGHNNIAVPLNPIEMNTLWNLAKVENERIRDLFIMTGLQDSENARHLRRRLEPAIQAVVGLDNNRRTALRAVVIAKLQDPKADATVQRTCIAIGLALGETDPVFSALALKWVLGGENRRPRFDAEIEFLANHVDSRDSRDLATRSVDVFKDEPFDVSRLDFDLKIHPEFPVLLKKLDPDDARQLASTFAELLIKVDIGDERNNPLTLAAVAQSYAAIAQFDEKAKLNTAALATRLGDAASHAKFSYDLEALAKSISLLNTLNVADLSGDATRLIDCIRAGANEFTTIPHGVDSPLAVDPASTTDMRRPFDYYDLRYLAECFVALDEFMTKDNAGLISQSLAVAYLNGLNDASTLRAQDANSFDTQHPIVDAVRAFQMLGPYFPDAQLPANIVEKMAGATDAEQRFALINLLDTALDQLTPDRISVEDSDRFWKQAADRLFGEKSLARWVSGEDTTRVIRAATSHLSEDECDVFLGAVCKLSQYAPENLRADLDAPFVSLGSIFLAGMTELCGQGLVTCDLYDVYQFKGALKNASDNERVHLAQAILRGLAQTGQGQREQEEWYSPVFAEDRELPPLGVRHQTMQQAKRVRVYRTWQIADVFAEVADTLDTTAAAAAARTILDRAEQMEASSDVAGLIKMFNRLVPLLSEADALTLARRIALQFETIGILDHKLSMLHAFRALTSKLPQHELIAFLRWPNCVGYQRTILVTEIGTRVNRKFASVWDLVAWAREFDASVYASLKSGPRRPSDEETRAGQRFEPAARPEGKDVFEIPRPREGPLSNSPVP